MKSKISFSGDPHIISLIAAAAQEIYDSMDSEPVADPKQTRTVTLHKGEQPGATGDAPQFEIGPDGLIIVPPKKQREKADYKAHREAAERARALQEIELAIPVPEVATAPVATQPQAPTEPNAYANHAIQQQAQWAQQPLHNGQQNTAPTFPAQGFPAAPAPTTQPVTFPASQPAPAPVGVQGQPWLNPAVVNQQGPTFNDLNSIIQPLVLHDRPRQILGDWLAHKQIANFETIADQPALLAEAYQIAVQVRDGILK